MVVVISPCGLAGQAATGNAPAPPVWDVQVGASFVGTSGNSETSTVGADFGVHRRWPLWRIESTAAAVRTSSEELRTAERYLGTFRGERRLTSRAGFSMGVKLERDRLAGMSFRAITDAGLKWALIRRAAMTLDGTTAMALSQERPIDGDDRNQPTGLFELMSRIPFGEAGATTQRLTFYPDFEEGSAHRAELELAGQAALNAHLALKIGYMVRRSNAPVAGFEKTDAITTASVVVQWQAERELPPQ
jgi:putative salt-induced outer membrane protein